MIYRLITRGTIEERMMQLTKKKMILEHLVVGRLKAQGVNQVFSPSSLLDGQKSVYIISLLLLLLCSLIEVLNGIAIAM